MSIDKSVLNTVSLEFSALARNKAHSGTEMLSLGLGEPGFSTPNQIIEAAYHSMLKGENRYSSPWGTPELLFKLREKIENDTVKVAEEELIITLGAKQALSLCLTSILEKNDEVILISPSFVSFKPQIKMADPTSIIKEISLNKSSFGLDFDALENSITSNTKAILINFPNNPTGAVLSKYEIEKLIKLAKKHNTYIISDEIYSSMAFENSNFISLLEYRDKYKNIFVIDGFSKAYSMTGWRIGYLIGPREHIKRVSVLQQHLNTNIPVFIQRGAEAALDLPNTFIEKYKLHLTENAKILNELIFGSNVLTCHDVKGGMFSLINISKLNKDSDTFCTDLLKSTNVAATPGIIFGIDWDDHIRVSLGGDKDQFYEAITRIVKFADKEASK
jgi:aspartate/methionine/tyrosine aminotransferase